MRLTYGSYPSEFLIPALGATFVAHEPFYFSTIKNDDGSYKQSGTHKSLELRLVIWNTIFWIELDYKRVILPPKFPKPGLQARLAAKRIARDKA